jgi:hypothetical protein
VSDIAHRLRLLVALLVVLLAALTGCIRFGQVKLVDDPLVGRAALFRLEGRSPRLQGSSSLGRVLYPLGPSGHEDNHAFYLLDATSLKVVLEGDAGWGRLDVARGQVVLNRFVAAGPSDGGGLTGRAEVRDARTGRRLTKHESREDVKGDEDMLLGRSPSNRTVRFPGGELEITAAGRTLSYHDAATRSVVFAEELPYDVGMVVADLDGPVRWMPSPWRGHAPPSATRRSSPRRGAGASGTCGAAPTRCATPRPRGWRRPWARRWLACGSAWSRWTRPTASASGVTTSDRPTAISPG